MRDQKADWKVTGDRDSDICFKTPWQCPKAFSLWLIRFPEGTLDLLCRRKSGQGLTVSLLIPLKYRPLLLSSWVLSLLLCRASSVTVGVRRWAAQKGEVSADPGPYRPSTSLAVFSPNLHTRHRNYLTHLTPDPFQGPAVSNGLLRAGFSVPRLRWQSNFRAFPLPHQ